MIVNALAGKTCLCMATACRCATGCTCATTAAPSAACSKPGAVGETYNVGGWNESPTSRSSTPCAPARRAAPRADGQSYKTQITYVTDRPGHDRRYAIDARKIERELGWKPAETFRHRHPQDRAVVSGQPRMGGAGAIGRLPRMGAKAIPGRPSGKGRGMNILLFGKGGRVGWELQRSLAVLGNVTALDHDSTDPLRRLCQPRRHRRHRARPQA